MGAERTTVEVLVLRALPELALGFAAVFLVVAVFLTAVLVVVVVVALAVVFLGAAFLAGALVVVFIWDPISKGDEILPQA